MPCPASIVRRIGSEGAAGTKNGNLILKVGYLVI
jgi:hypothetical protein